MCQLYRLILTLCWVILSSKSLVRVNCESHECPQVSLSSGCVEGLVKTTVLGRTYYSFQGIPYAAPPTGNLRFKAPRPPAQWSGVLKAFKEPSACLQPWRENPFPIHFNEDCLYLNVFTPYLKHPNGKPMPVIVWIHGGKFYQSSGSTYKYGPDFFLTKDVILVNINYRLGIFGYLNLNISEAQGNASMKDKIAALRWVQQEIAKFGGDPTRVTIVGGSSGASDVAYLYISPLAKGLFHAAISHSGAALCSWAFLPSTTVYSLQVAASLGCPTHDPWKAVSCLRNTHGSVLAEQQMIVGGQVEGIELPFLPSVESYLGEEVFLPDSPQNLIHKSGDIPYIIGMNDGEGLMYVSDLKEYDLKHMKDTIISRLPFKNISQAALHEITSRIDKFYFGQNTSSNKSIDGFINFMTDKQFSFCILKTVEAISARAPVYLYYFTFRGNFEQVHPFTPLNLSGLCHGDELGYFFYRNYTVKAHNNISLYPRDMAMVEKTIELWTTFATYGNPTPFLQDTLNTTWEAATMSVNNHLVIGDVLEMKHYSLLRDREVFWEKLYQIIFYQITTFKRAKEHFYGYTVMCLLVLFSIIFAVSYYIQYKRERSLYFKL